MKSLNTIEVKTQTQKINTFKVLNNDIESLSGEIENLANNNKQFQQMPVILEIDQVDFQANELAILVEILTQNNIVTIGIRTQKQELIDFAKFSGLAIFGKALTADEPKKPSKNDAKKPSKNEPKKPSKNKPKNEPSKPHQDKTYKAPKIVAYKVHSSAQILAKDGDLVLLNTVKRNSEVIAHGSISAYKEVSGSVFAGVSGDKKATIFIQSFNAQLVSIAGVYKQFETVPVKLYARPVMIDLKDEKLRFQIV